MNTVSRGNHPTSGCSSFEHLHKQIFQKKGFSWGSKGCWDWSLTFQACAARFQTSTRFAAFLTSSTGLRLRVLQSAGRAERPGEGGRISGCSARRWLVLELWVECGGCSTGGAENDPGRWPEGSAGCLAPRWSLLRGSEALYQQKGWPSADKTGTYSCDVAAGFWPGGGQRCNQPALQEAETEESAEGGWRQSVWCWGVSWGVFFSQGQDEFGNFEVPGVYQSTAQCEEIYSTFNGISYKDLRTAGFSLRF